MSVSPAAHQLPYCNRVEKKKVLVRQSWCNSGPAVWSWQKVLVAT